ncbi:hypothetical protein K491DRAFT_595158 [Lophiostoma macrostomum CBS 122681]|uniref:Rho-GAP domain-containing protein n=1 Tax=Lophiostoma macrostomum CBS 122681 TaxID=1314788 RepID=A0A6A6TEE6_9PLEO|nr:hypothetical protein K491DRAFT_595158 [Lophiostoma macrostomum CBS 122681]
MPKSSTLSLAMRSRGGKESVASPASPRSPVSPHAVHGAEADATTPTAPYHNMPDSPASPKPRKDSKSIFSNFGATKSSSRIASPDHSIRTVPGQEVAHAFYGNGRGGGSTPDLSRPVQTPNSEGTCSAWAPGHPSLTAVDNRSEAAGAEPRMNSTSAETPEQSLDANNAKRQGKAKKSGMLSRSKSIKIEENASNRAKLRANPPKISPEAPASWSNGDAVPLKTAPLEKGQSWRQNISFGKLRTHSADRHDGSQSSLQEIEPPLRKDRAEQSSLASSSYNESKGATLMSSLGSGARKMGERMETARKGVFGKLGRSTSNHDRELQIPKEQYQFKIIHEGLVEQTRLTRISSRLENSKDKTEFWMPALPWRCIDYLNMKGCEEEGLYRVPGAAHQVKFYEQKFDQETDRDIDLIADDNLNDPNVIGSLFKNWLRQLPDEIFPKATQARIQQECQGAKSTPQMLKDELSKLPPFNYYLLFAITCHISLLHSCAEFNKMNYSNLCICFQPAIKIDAFCFQFLILDWRNCWQGCWTEKEYLTEEVKLLEDAEAQPPPTNGHVPQGQIKSKGPQSSSGYLGDSLKASSGRSNSSDRSKPGSNRGISADRSVTSGRATPPSIYAPDRTNNSRRGTASEREPSTDRATSSSHSREAFNASETPRRAPASLSTDALGDDEDSSATPTQAQHNRGESQNNQFRLDLSNPPSSPFSIKF